MLHSAVLQKQVDKIFISLGAIQVFHQRTLILRDRAGCFRSLLASDNQTLTITVFVSVVPDTSGGPFARVRRLNLLNSVRKLMRSAATLGLKFSLEQKWL